MSSQHTHFNSTIFKTWITDLTKLQSVVNNIKNIDAWANGATGLLNSNVVTNLSSAINGLNLQQAKLVLSTKNLTQEQMNQVLVQSGLIASENNIQGELLQSALIQSSLSAEKQKAILTELNLMNAETGEILISKSCTKEKLLNVLATKGVTGANAEAIISTLGLSSANKKATLSFGLFTKATLAQVKAQLALVAVNPVTWILAVVGVIYGAIKAFDALTVSFDEAIEKTKSSKEELDQLTSEISDLNNELKTTKDRIEELLEKANSGTISLLEEEELNNLREQNDELQREIALKEKLAEFDAKDAAKNAANSLTYKTDDNIWDQEYNATDRIDKLQKYVDSANFYQDKLSEINQQILDIEESATDNSYKEDSIYKDLIKHQGEYQEGLRKVEGRMSSTYKELSKEDDGLYYNGKVIEGYEYLVERLDTVYTSVELYLDEDSAKDTTEDYIETIKNKLVESGLSEEISNAVAEGFSEEELTSIMSSESIDWSQCLGLDDATAVIENIKEQLASVGNANKNTPSFSDIFALKDAEGNLNTLGELNEQLDNIQAAYKNLTDAMDTYSSTGSITIDQFQAIVEQGAKFLDYLTLEDGQLGVNEQAMYDLAEARIIEMKAQMVQGVIDNVSKIKEEGDEAGYLASTNYELANSYHELAESQLRAWSSSALKNGLSQDTINRVLNKAHTDIEKINALVANINLDSIGNLGSGDAKEAAQDMADLLDKELAVLDTKMEAGYIDFKDYIKARLALINDYYAKGKIKADQYYSYLEKHYKQELSYRDKVIKAVARRIDKEIDGLEKQKDDIESYYKVQIDALTKKKTLLEEANREREREYNLQKSLYELERARNQRTKLVNYMPDTIVI